MFCSGIGEDTPDITTSSRPMKEVERELCKRNKINEVIEIIIGYDGVVIANSNQSHRFDFTKKDLFETLSAYSQENDKLVKIIRSFGLMSIKPYQKQKLKFMVHIKIQVHTKLWLILLCLINIHA